MSQYYRHGYAYEAATRLLDAGVNDFKLKNIKAITVPDNIASQKLLSKLGLTYIKTIQLPDDPVDLMYFELL